MNNRIKNPQATTFGQFFYGLLCGLCFGLIISALIAWVISTKSMPQSGKAHSEDALSKLIANCDTNTGTKPNNTITAPSFDFYQKDANGNILNNISKTNPSKSEVDIDSIIENSMATNDAQTTKNINVNIDKLTNKIPATVNDVTKIKQSVILKSKTYDKLSDAEEVKANLALIGVNTRIDNKQNQYSVYVGSYKNLTDAENAKLELGDYRKNFEIQQE